jgi:methyl-accepting chemotaxis protein
MTTETLSAREAAERLEVSYSTLKGWLDRLPLGLGRNDRGEYRIDTAALQVLATVRDWRSDGNGMTTITRRLVPIGGDRPEQAGPAADEPSPVHGSAMDESQGATIPAAQLLPMVQEVSRLALALSEASYRQGQLEQQVCQLTAQADETAATLTDARQTLQQAQERAAMAEGEAKALRQQMEAMQARPWWRRVFG